MSFNFQQETHTVHAFGPTDLSDGGATGDWVSLSNYGRAAIVFCKAAGGSTEPAVLTLEQAKTSTGGDAKALDFDTVYVKSSTDMSGVSEFTVATQASTNSFEFTGNHEALAIVEIDAASLDVNNAFAWLRASAGDVGSTTQLASCVYVLCEPRASQEVPVGAIS